MERLTGRVQMADRKNKALGDLAMATRKNREILEHRLESVSGERDFYL